MVKKIIGTCLLLALFTGLAGLAVAMTNEATADVIAEQLEAEKINGMKAVYPNGGDIKDETEKYLNDQTPAEILEINCSYEGDKLQGVIYTVETQGYNAAVQTLVGYDLESQKITGVKVIQQSETPGLGDNSKNDWFGARFMGKKATQELLVTKVEPVGEDEVQAITSATITTTAIVDGVNICRQHFEDKFLTTP